MFYIITLGCDAVIKVFLSESDNESFNHGKENLATQRMQPHQVTCINIPVSHFKMDEPPHHLGPLAASLPTKGQP